MKIPHLASLVLLSLLLSGCADHLKFEVISEGVSFLITDRDASSKAPGIMVISSSDEIVPPDAGLEFPTTLETKLRKIDFNHNFVLLVMRGWMPESGVVYDVIRKGSKISIFTKPEKIGPGNYELPDFTHPYQLILISKEENWDTVIHFIVERGNKGIITQVDHYIP